MTTENRSCLLSEYFYGGHIGEMAFFIVVMLIGWAALIVTAMLLSLIVTFIDVTQWQK